jgi:Zn-dependent protease
VVLLAAVSAHGPIDVVISGSTAALASGEGLWAGIAFLGLLQITAAILNLLPIPGLDGWGAIEPWVKPETAAAAAKIAPLGLLAVFAILFWFPGANEAFFRLVYWFYDLSGADRFAPGFGNSLFRFWNLSG